MNKFKRVAIYSSKNDKQILEIASHCIEVLKNQKIEIILTDNLVSLKKSGLKVYKNQNNLINKTDLIISIGGDGTLLGCARRYGFFGIPVLGINLGNLGFLADIPPEAISNSLLEVINGNYIKDSRFFLEANLTHKNKKFIALNEIVIHSGAIAQLIDYEVYIDSLFAYRQRADGLIINTPTGSTAYSLSGGGPIVHPGLDAITLLPMFPHSLNTSPLVINSEIKIVLKKNKSRAMLSLDSHDSLMLKAEDSLIIKKARSELTLIHPLGHDFFSSCRNKLGWSSSITNGSS